MADKNITLHPLRGDGAIDTSTNLFPKTVTTQVVGLSDALNGKQNVLPSYSTEGTLEQDGTITIDETTSATIEFKENHLYHLCIYDEGETTFLKGFCFNQHYDGLIFNIYPATNKEIVITSVNNKYKLKLYVNNVVTSFSTEGTIYIFINEL